MSAERVFSHERSMAVKYHISLLASRNAQLHKRIEKLEAATLSDDEAAAVLRRRTYFDSFPAFNEALMSGNAKLRAQLETSES